MKGKKMRAKINKAEIEEEIIPTEEQLEDINNLNKAISKGSSDFRLALREISKKKGGIAVLSEKSGIGREHLYKILSNKGQTRTESIFKIMNALGYRFKLKRKENTNE